MSSSAFTEWRPEVGLSASAPSHPASDRASMASMERKRPREESSPPMEPLVGSWGARPVGGKTGEDRTTRDRVSTEVSPWFSGLPAPVLRRNDAQATRKLPRLRFRLNLDEEDSAMTRMILPPSTIPVVLEPGTPEHSQTGGPIGLQLVTLPMKTDPNGPESCPVTAVMQMSNTQWVAPGPIQA